MTNVTEDQFTFADLGLWSGKTSPELSAAEPQRERTLPQSLKKSSKSANRKAPMCVCVYRTEDGQKPDAFTLKMVPGALLGDFTMHSFGESPREENASRLSQILEDSAPQKYSLSAKACQGILNRAARRGKELPTELLKALEAQSVSKNEPGNPGGGKGLLLQNERTGALSTLNNQSVLPGNGPGMVERKPDSGNIKNPCGGDSTKANLTLAYSIQGNTIDRDVKQNGGGISTDTAHTLNGTDRHGVYAAGFDGTMGAKAYGIGYEEERAMTTTTSGGGIASYAVDCRNFRESEGINGTLQAKPNGGFSYNCGIVIRQGKSSS